MQEPEVLVILCYWDDVEQVLPVPDRKGHAYECGDLAYERAVVHCDELVVFEWMLTTKTRS